MWRPLLLATSLFLPAAASPDQPQWVTLGTGGGPVVQVKRSQPANALVVGKSVYLFDVGEGAQRQMKLAGLDLGTVKAVFLTHHHLDHVGGLGPIIVNRWILALSDTIPVFGPPGTRALVDGLVAAAQPTERAPLALDGAPVAPIAGTVRAVDLSAVGTEPLEVYHDANIRVLAVAVDHFHDANGKPSRAATSFAYRVEGGGRTIVFSGDTGPSAGLERLAKGADLLVCEVMDRQAIAGALARMNLPPARVAGFLRHMDLDHLVPTEIGAIARRAGVKAVVLTHLVPGRDEETGTAGYVAGLSKQFTGPVTVANDGDRF